MRFLSELLRLLQLQVRLVTCKYYLIFNSLTMFFKNNLILIILTLLLNFNIRVDIVNSKTSALNTSLAPIVQPNADVFCAVCNISVSAKDEMTNHLKGSRHSKRLRAAGIAPYTPNADVDTIMQCVRSSIIELLPTIKQMQRDTSINRTPSGHFYCKTCNVTLDTEVTFMQHLDSKRHRRQNK